jgi:cell division septation protein DedD
MTGLTFDTRAKERLTGAAIIVIVTVLWVPEVLRGPIQAPRTVVEVSRSNPIPSSPIPMDARAPLPAALPQEAVRPSASPAEIPPAATDSQPPTASASGLDVDVDAQPPPAPAQQPVQPAQGVAPAQPQAELSADPVPSAPIRPASAAGSRVWSVQLGSFSTPDAAQRLVEQLSGEGVHAYVAASFVTGQMLYRVRTTTTDRASAQAIAEQLRATGHDASVMAR